MTGSEDDAKTELLSSAKARASTEKAEKKAAKRARRGGRRGWKARFFSPDSPFLVYLGLGVVVAGFALLTFTWNKVAGLLVVPLQLPFIASGGLVGLGLVLVGLAITSIAVKRRDMFARKRNLQKLAATLDSITVALGGSSSNVETGTN
jgi:hypothetical protein